MTPPAAWPTDAQLVARAICQARHDCRPCLAGFAPCQADETHGEAARAAVEALRRNHRLITPPRG